MTFRSVISTSINALLRELEYSCEAFFQQMLKTAWPSIDSVSGQSARLGEFMEHINAVNVLVQDNLLQKKYKRSFCDKAVK